MDDGKKKSASYRSLLICHENESLSFFGLSRWLAHHSELCGIVVIREPASRLWLRLKREYRRAGLLGFIDVLLFRFYYRLLHARSERRWSETRLGSLYGRYAPVSDKVPILYTASPNSAAVEEFMRAAQCDIAIARCKTLLQRRIYSLPRVATLVMHPGVCPEYRNAHGCFWALAKRDLKKVGMSLLKIDDGIDTGPVYGYFSADFDESRESHAIIQHRVVFDNLPAIARKLEEIAQGSAQPIDTAGRASQVWGQPRLSRYLFWKWRARMERGQYRDEGVLLYHDVTAAGAHAGSGFAGAGSDIYKLDTARFDAHLHALKQAFPLGPATMRGGESELARVPLMLTFDDGGVTAYTEVAPRLEALGWRGHFFITTERIGTPGFMSADQICDLHRRGHVIGSHSVSHPPVMSALSREDLLREWTQSIATLSDIIGEPVQVASVPGGYTSKQVAKTAAAAGISLLMTSEPSVHIARVGGLQVIGRFTIKHSTPPEAAVALAGYSPATQWRQWARWNGLKLVKKSLGRGYPLLREAMLGLRQSFSGVSH